jgi:hypothetical protein
MMTTANTPNPETDAPSGPVRRLRAALALALDGLAALGPLAWLLGRVLSDRFLWSQYLEWIPTELAVLASGVPLALASALRRAAPASSPGPRSPSCSSGCSRANTACTAWSCPRPSADRSASRS